MFIYNFACKVITFYFELFVDKYYMHLFYKFKFDRLINKEGI